MLSTSDGIDFSLPPRPVGPFAINVLPIQCAPTSTTCGYVADQALQYPPKLWSLPSSWPSNQIPLCGADVVIPPGVIMQLDISPTCTLGNVVVYGKLQFLDNSDKVFPCASLLVLGYLEIGL